MNRQTIRTDLETALRSTQNAWDRLPLLVELAKEPTRNDPEAGLHYAREALTIANSLNDSFWRACSLQAIGIRLGGKACYTESQTYLQQASFLFAQMNDRQRQASVDLNLALIDIFTGKFEEAHRRLFNNMAVVKQMEDHSVAIRLHEYFGHTYKGIGDLGKALKHYQQALNIAKEVGLISATGYLYQDIALVYRQTGDSSNHHEFLLQSLKVHTETNDKEGISTTMINIASLYLEQHQFSRAEPFVLRGRELCQELGFIANEAITWGQSGEIYHYRSDTCRANQCYERGIALALQSEHNVILAKLYEHYGIVCMETGNIDKALTNLRSALDIIANSGYPGYEYEIHQSLATLYDKQGEAALALKHYKEYTSIKETYISEQKILEAGRVEMRDRIELLNKRLRTEQSARTSLQEQVEQKEQELVSLTLKLIQQEKGNGKRNRTTRKDDAPAHTQDNWDLFARRFHKVHHGFYSNLVKKCPELTPTEIRVCSLIRIGLTSKEIASILGVSKRTIDSHREHIHKKLNISSRLASFIAQI